MEKPTNNQLLTSEETFDGFVSLWRKVTRSVLWQLDTEEFKIAILCLIKANHKDNLWFDGSKYIPIKRGSFVSSRDHFSKEVGNGISASKVYRTWKKLEKVQFLHIETNNEYSLIILVNYNKHQTPVNNEMDRKRTASEQVVNINNNDNNGNNIEDKSSTGDGGNPVRSETKEYGNEKVNFVLKEFSRVFQLSKPSDRKPRQWAYQISRQLPNKEDVTNLMEWIFRKDWGKNVGSIETIYRKLSMFEREKGGIYATEAKFDNPEWLQL